MDAKHQLIYGNLEKDCGAEHLKSGLRYVGAWPMEQTPLNLAASGILFCFSSFSPAEVETLILAVCELVTKTMQWAPFEFFPHASQICIKEGVPASGCM